LQKNKNIWGNLQKLKLLTGKEIENMARKYRRLSYEDREKIEMMCREGKKTAEIANSLGTHRTTIYLELKRGGAGNGKRLNYSAEQAQKQI
jgi:IS30 family transposase